MNARSHVLWPSIAVAVGFCCQSKGEEPALRLFTTTDGLVRNWVNQIRRDTRGSLWFCTVEGLSLFDGRQFTNYTVKDGLPDRMVNDIVEASQGEYWVATNSGLCRFRPRSWHSDRKSQQAVFRPSRLAGNSRREPVATALARAPDGDIWFGTGLGFEGRADSGRLYRTGAGQDTPEPVEFGSRASITSLLVDREGAVWVGTWQGLYRRRADGRVDSLGSGLIKALLADRAGRIWAGGEGLFAFRVEGGEPRLVASYREAAGLSLMNVQSLHETPDGNIWIGTGGLVRFRPDDLDPRSRFHRYPSSTLLNSQNIFALEEDIERNLWLATSNLGVVRILRRAFSTFNETDGLESRIVIGLHETRGGTLIAVTGQHHVLNQFDGARFTPVRPKLPAHVHNMGWGEREIALQDRAGDWWLATGAGLARYVGAHHLTDLSRVQPRIYTRRDGLPSDVVLRLFEDSQGGIWVGCSQGLARWDRSTGSFQTFPAGETLRTTDPAPQSFAEDRAGNVWIGFFPAGLVRYRQGLLESIPIDAAGQVNALHTDRQGRLWIASSRGGLVCIDKPGARTVETRTYRVEDGLSSGQLFSLAEDRAGRIYIAGGKGVDRLETTTGRIAHYSVADGLPIGETQRMIGDGQGGVWFASNFGLSRYVPGDETPALPRPPVLYRVRVAGVPMVVSDQGESLIDGLEFRTAENNLHIDFGSQDFSANGALYQYRLDPVDSNWSAPSPLRTVQYANLAPKRYRFQLRAVDSGGQINTQTAALAFRIFPPFWRTWWFAGVLAVLGSTAIYLLYRYRLNHLLALERIRTRLALDLHDEIGAGLAEIAILSEVAKRQAGAALGLHLDQVAERARELRGAMTDIVWAVDPRKDNLADLVRRMRQTAFSLFESRGQRLEFHAPAEDRTAQLELAPDRRRNVLLFFKEAVTNIARHADATLVRIEVTLDRSTLRLSVADDGRGFALETCRRGAGLNSMRYRAEQLQGTLHLASAPGSGTRVELAIGITQRNAPA